MTVGTVLARPPLVAKMPGTLRLAGVANAAFAGVDSLAILLQIVSAALRVAVATRAAAVGTAMLACAQPFVVASATVAVAGVETRGDVAAAVFAAAREQVAWPPRGQRHCEPSQ